MPLFCRRYNNSIRKKNEWELNFTEMELSERRYDDSANRGAHSAGYIGSNKRRIRLPIRLHFGILLFMHNVESPTVFVCCLMIRVNNNEIGASH